MCVKYLAQLYTMNAWPKTTQTRVQHTNQYTTVHTAQFLSHIASIFTLPTNHSVSLPDAILCTGLKKIDNLYISDNLYSHLVGRSITRLVVTSTLVKFCLLIFFFGLSVGHTYVHCTSNVVKFLDGRVWSRGSQGRDLHSYQFYQVKMSPKLHGKCPATYKLLVESSCSKKLSLMIIPSEKGCHLYLC